jgi:hypothetical protein
MSALIVTLGAGIPSLRRAMAGANPLVADAAMKMASLSVVGLKVGIGAALGGGASALAGGIKAVTPAANFEKVRDAFATLIGDAAKAEQALAQQRELRAQKPFPFPRTGETPETCQLESGWYPCGHELTTAN